MHLSNQYRLLWPLLDLSQLLMWLHLRIQRFIVVWWKAFSICRLLDEISPMLWIVYVSTCMCQGSLTSRPSSVFFNIFDIRFILICFLPDLPPASLLPILMPIGLVARLIGAPLVASVCILVLTSSLGAFASNRQLHALAQRLNAKSLLTPPVSCSGFNLSFVIWMFLSVLPVLWCDNLGATYLTANHVLHSRTKHVDVDFHFVRDWVASKSPVVSFVSSKD